MQSAIRSEALNYTIKLSKTYEDLRCFLELCVGTRLGKSVKHFERIHHFVSGITLDEICDIEG